jgi:hypothetical protein
MAAASGSLARPGAAARIAEEIFRVATGGGQNHTHRATTD